VATGADKAFIGLMDELDVEPTRKLPLASTKDIVSGLVRWRGHGVINPFEDDGKLVNLAAYPKLRTHLEKHRELIAARHVAQKSPTNWYRTIDRITPSIAKKSHLAPLTQSYVSSRRICRNPLSLRLGDLQTSPCIQILRNLQHTYVRTPSGDIAQMQVVLYLLFYT
jgi:hypothetical protein